MKENTMSRISLIAAALPIAGLVLLGGAGTAFAATPTTGSAAQPALTAATFGGGVLTCGNPSPNPGDDKSSCGRGDDGPPPDPNYKRNHSS
jgi:hypothetical protein